MKGKKRILLVDDEEGFTRLLKLLLEDTGDYEVRTESDGSGALAAAREFSPDLILLDIIMPEVDGGEVAAQLKADARLRHVPVVYLTAIVSKKELQAQTGVIRGHVFIAKPVSKQTLLEVIEKELAKPHAGP